MGNGTVEAPTARAFTCALLPSIYATICILGVSGNSVVVYTILTRSKFCSQLSVPDIFILSLSFVDLLFLLGMPLLIHQLLGNGAWCFGAVMCTLISALDSSSQTASTYILTAMTLDRYLATVHPMRFTQVRTPRAAILVVALVEVISLVSIAPVWLYTGLMPLADGVVGCALLLPNPVPDAHWYTLYQFALAFALPLSVICLAFFKMLQSMISSVAPVPPRRRHVRARRMTRMAVAICLAFFLCWGPYYALQLAHLAIPSPSAPFLYAYHLAITLGYANSCINPLLYIVLSQAFKTQLRRALPLHCGPCCKRKVGPGAGSGHASFHLHPGEVPFLQESPCAQAHPHTGSLCRQKSQHGRKQEEMNLSCFAFTMST